MLINGQRPEELRVAIVANGQLENYLVDVADSGLRRGNIYRGVVAGVQPSLNAAFVEFGAERHGFLASHDVVPEAFHRSPPKGERHPRIDHVLERGKTIVVQVTKDAMGQKGAALTTNVSLAGRYLVFTPLDSMRGLSRKVEDEAARRAIKEKAKGLTLPEGAGYIIRTNAADQTKTTLNRDLGALLRLWKRITTEARVGRGPRLLYSDQDLIIQVLRDYLDPDIQEVWIDNEVLLEKADAFVKTFMPRSKVSLRGYTERLPLFSRFQLEPQIDAIFQRKVPLPCGGSIVIDSTEALTAIDVNSGKARSGGSQEDNILRVNLEAAEEVARQLRLRDIGGLIVVDFIDMRAAKNNKAVEKAVKDALRNDKARSTVTRISENGLLEINRQRIQQALQLRTHRTCPTCGGLGLIASPEHVALGVIRRIEARAVEGTIQGVTVSLHPELADHIQNEHRRELTDLEEEFDLSIEVFASPGMHRHEEQLEWTRRERAPRVAPPRNETAASAADLASGTNFEEEPSDYDEPAGDIEDGPGPSLLELPPWEADELEAARSAETGPDPAEGMSAPIREEYAEEQLPGDFGWQRLEAPGLTPGVPAAMEVPPEPPHCPPMPAIEPEQVGASATAPRKRRRRRRKPKTGTESGSAAPGSLQQEGRPESAAQGLLFESLGAPPAPPQGSEHMDGSAGDNVAAENGGAAAKKRRRRRRKPKPGSEGGAAATQASQPSQLQAPKTAGRRQGTPPASKPKDQEVHPVEAAGAGEASKPSRRRRRRKR
jgi:ribonuclease E